jgi:hypothetical protein
VKADWFEPQRALNMHCADRLPMGYTAIKQLESLVPFATAAGARHPAPD